MGVGNTPIPILKNDSINKKGAIAQITKLKQ